ncbi:MAG: SLC13/DASS family transporter [Phycisphaerales bacterium]|nr:SLC13/DASS family transporter [Phycisphaerales bacterium]
MVGTDPHQGLHSRVSWAGLLVGPLLAALAYFLLPGGAAPDQGLSDPGRATAALAVLMAAWWLTEAIPLSATALLPLVCLPLSGAAGIKAAAAPYANDVIFLFLGGFILGLAMERSSLHRRIAYLTLLAVGTSPRRLIAGFMVASAVISMWVSNTATTIMMLPIALSVISLVAARHAPPGTPPGEAPSPDPNFDSTLLLGVAYASSIGGVATLIGTAPNAILKGYLSSNLHIELSFAHWLLLGVPLVALYLPVAWFYLVFISQPVRLKTIPGGRDMIRRELHALGPVSRAEWIVMAVFFSTVLLWIGRPLLTELGTRHGLVALAGLNDASIAIAAALALFLIPVQPRTRTFAMDWHTAERLPWGVLLLFGGGLSLAAAISANGVDSYLGAALAGLGHLQVWLAVVLVCTVVILLTELTSNTAVTTAFLPILAAGAVAMGIPPLRLLVPATLAASMAFMLPVATPPNAIVFGSGRITIGQMARAGLGLNLAGIVLISAATLLAGDFILRIMPNP